ncbi:alpha/beta hydrolase [Antarcticibacterium flavum]|uniref:Alpha/beta hydrolase n=2 Tax=Flavobacteriaceae TaxID=49546 RepID=A0A5B7X899_9FLAO|nr:haloalkane dehalogenase [Antarcticibacterium sp. W02-3]QCY71355.1 alpha/beta hydrolase [Antarcticibacterium flavum]
MKTQEKIKKIIQVHENSGTYLSVDGIKTFALDYGKGEAIVCIHGVPTSSFLYRKVLTELAAKNYRGIAIDLPGLGLSARPEDFEYTFSNFSRFLKKALAQLNVEKFHLVVHDIGGPIGFALAATNMEKILSLTILNTWVDVVNFKKPLPMRPFEKKILGEAELKLLTHTTWPLMFSTLGVNNDDGIREEEIKAYVDLLKREDDGKAFLKIMRNFEDSEEFRRLCIKAVKDTPYPVQVIWGEDDPALSLKEYGEEIKKYADLKFFKTLPSKHFLQEEVWKELAAEIAAFAGSADTRS